MNTVMKSFLSAIIIFSFSALAHAEDPNDHQDGPCKKIMDACKMAKGESKQKMAIYKDCFQPIMNNQSVAGVAVDKADVSACKAKREAHQQKKGK